ncbi:uncharacterized protein LACBIDRAFT_329804 [Laccaria bicolor S238N-H82]|uniref:Predicted protein n=1 Tax=Laccaria bicolor (strain S238N-H82 / ATCC MYA-4686) TaxID=486041 RepID=B0DJA2_LACBS|nr:uncharacterized protein LACBIDRAFT_329804 [Laccaria bicolor S238N-H82]EDR05487.1 predicted protein [Laccaria bicolor S238N-H82]|eukprot:XP_001884045.1 predicted protein [Laccaria bicolor S238N-H82]
MHPNTDTTLTKHPIWVQTLSTVTKYRNQVLDEIYGRHIGLKDIIEAPNAKSTPCVRYAQGGLSGTYDDQVFSGLVEAVVRKHDREERGVGMQNFRYAPASGKRLIELWATFATLQSCKVAKVAKVRQLCKYYSAQHDFPSTLGMS